MSEAEQDEFAELSVDQEDTVRKAREWVQSMVNDAQKSNLHLQMIALEMMAQGMVILTEGDIETARADIMRMFRDGENGTLVLRKIAAPAPSPEAAT